MKSLDLDWPTIDAWLKKISGFDPKAVQPYFQEGQLKKGIHFFLIEYDPGEIIMAKGTTSDFAALHLQGIVRVLNVAPKSTPQRAGCWTNPALRRLENIVLNPPLLTPVFTSGNAISFTAGTAGEFSFTVWGLPPVTFRIEKTDEQTGLPPFVKFERDTLVLNAKTAAPGEFRFTVIASNGTGSARQDITMTVHPADKPGEQPPPPTRTGSPLGFLRPVYRALPSLPLGLIRFADFWLPPGASDRVRRHIAAVFRGQSLRADRPEREVSRPTQAAKVEDAAEGFAISTRDAAGNELPIEDRFMGITGTLWNQGRSVTLAAANDGEEKCRMLLIKRKAFQEIIKKCPAFYERKMVEFVNNTLPTILSKNRLFRERVFASDVRDWGKLLRGLQGQTSA
ncbi:MAG: Ig domain-containing protein, partial [Planctomycetota bacterium]